MQFLSYHIKAKGRKNIWMLRELSLCELAHQKPTWYPLHLRQREPSLFWVEIAKKLPHHLVFLIALSTGLEAIFRRL